jgi:hypothetical protein
LTLTAPRRNSTTIRTDVTGLERLQDGVAGEQRWSLYLRRDATPVAATNSPQPRRVRSPPPGSLAPRARERRSCLVWEVERIGLSVPRIVNDRLVRLTGAVLSA